jgi:hypothetical protein
VAAGENVTCTFTNTKNSTVTIIKDSLPNDAQDFGFTGSCFGAFNLDDDADGTLLNTKSANLSPGSCTVTEGASPPGWSFTNLVCSDPDGGTTVSAQTATIDLDVGETISCTYTNSKDATVVIVKNTDPNAAQDFAFACGGLGLFTLDDDADGTLPNTQTFTGVVAGSYTCTESTQFGYQITINCTDPDLGTTVAEPSATIDVDPGETVTCTFLNVFFVPSGPHPVGGIAGLLDSEGSSPMETPDPTNARPIGVAIVIAMMLAAGVAWVRFGRNRL